ncbi:MULTISPECIES: serine protease [unclassified Chamaesiphon]|uniref:S1 family peptidase n=1 Tax=unclassified Chamaesiphon TaxID=2620921 RepID=UPI00286C0E24|nr:MULTISPECIES: serine protease [unclassified Chamaesiphon]
MRNSHHLASILTGTAVVSAIVMTLPGTARALPGTQVNDIAREVTVLIRGEQGHGSGVIIQRNGNTYYVLTADHVVRQRDNFKLVTADKQAHAIDYTKIKRLDGVDLAVVKFTSDKNYPVAKISTAKASEGQDVFVSGWPSNGAVGNAAGGELVRQFTSGSISGFLPKSLSGYSMIYTNVTRAGMSGCPVLDTAGRLVGIHGMGDKEDARQLMESGLSQEAAMGLAAKLKPGFNYAVPIGVFLNKAGVVGIDTDTLQIDKSPAPEAGAVYVAGAQPDPRDKIDNIQATLNSVRQVTETVNNVTETVDDTRRTINNFRRSFGF